MNKKNLGKLVFVLMLLAIFVAPVLAGSGPGPLPEPPGGDGKPHEYDGEVEWWPGDPAWLECERAGVDLEEFPFSIRIGTGSAQGGMLFTAYGNEIYVWDVWSKGRTDDIRFNWTADPDPIYKVIVKSGRAANIYTYDPSAYDDYELKGIVPWDPSHLTFCWGPGGNGNGDECYWTEETAWGAGPRYVEQGNLATYTPYLTGVNI